MMTKAEAHAALDAWFQQDFVGNIYFFRAPRASTVDCFIEQTVKLREMPAAEASAFIDIFQAFNFSTAELARNKKGEPDRIKMVRSFPCKFAKESTPSP